MVATRAPWVTFSVGTTRASVTWIAISLAAPPPIVNVRVPGPTVSVFRGMSVLLVVLDGKVERDDQAGGQGVGEGEPSGDDGAVGPDQAQELVEHLHQLVTAAGVAGVGDADVEVELVDVA